MKLKLIIFALVVFVSEFNVISAQSESEYFDLNGRTETRNQNYYDFTLEIALRRTFLGYFYVEGVNKEAFIEGYYYNGEYYTDNNLEDYGIVFPLKAESPIAKIEFNTSINVSNVAYDVVFDVNMELTRKYSINKEIKFDEKTTEALKNYAKENNIKKDGSYLWEKYGRFSTVDIVEFSSITQYDIESAIKSFLSDQKVKKKRRIAREKKEEKKRDKKNEKKMKQRSSSYSIASGYYYKAKTAYNSGNYSLAQKYINLALEIEPYNSSFNSLAQIINEKNMVTGFSNTMVGLASAGITTGVMYNSESTFGLVFGYHSGSDSYRKNKPDNWSFLVSWGFLQNLMADEDNPTTTYNLMVGIPFDIYNPLNDIPLPLLSAYNLTFSVGLSIISSDEEKQGWNFGLQDISGSIGSYLVYDTIFGFEFGIMAHF